MNTPSSTEYLSLTFRILYFANRGHVRLVHPEGPHLEGRRPDALVVLVCGLSESTSRWTM